MHSKANAQGWRLAVVSVHSITSRSNISLVRVLDLVQTADIVVFCAFCFFFQIAPDTQRQPKALRPLINFTTVPLPPNYSPNEDFGRRGSLTPANSCDASSYTPDSCVWGGGGPRVFRSCRGEDEKVQRKKSIKKRKPQNQQRRHALITKKLHWLLLLFCCFFSFFHVFSFSQEHAVAVLGRIERFGRWNWKNSL